MNRFWTATALSLLFGCASDCPDDPTFFTNCPASPKYVNGLVNMDLGAPVAFDSVRVRLYLGSVETGTPVRTAIFGTGSRSLSWSEPFGSYAAKATYWKSGISVTAIDGGTTDVSQKSSSNCNCPTSSLRSADLDLEIDTWPR